MKKIKELEKYTIQDKKKLLEVQKETVDSFKQFFGDYEVIFETVEELEKKFNLFFKWRNEEWIVPEKNKTSEQLWKEQGNDPIKLKPFKLKDKFSKDMKKFGLIVDSIHGIVIVPFYGHLKEFFAGDYKKVPDYWDFFYKVIAETDKFIPSFVLRNIILKNKEKALKIFKEGYKNVKTFDEIFDLLSEFREDWDDGPQQRNYLIDSEKAGYKKEQLKEVKTSMKEFELAWKEFFKDKSKPQTDEEDRKQQEEFHHWYNNVRKQGDTGKTPVEMGQRIMNFEWDEDYSEDIDFEEEDILEAKLCKVTLIEKISILAGISFPDEDEKAFEKFQEENKKEIEIMQSEIDFNRAFQAWFLLEYRLPNGKTPMEFVFSRRDLDKLFSKKEISMIGNLLAHIQSLFEIKKISKNKKNYTIENVLDNKSYIIKTIDFPAKLNMGDLISATIVQKLEGDYFFYGNVATYSKKEGQRMKNFMLKEIGKL